MICVASLIGIVSCSGNVHYSSGWLVLLLLLFLLVFVVFVFVDDYCLCLLNIQYLLFLMFPHCINSGNNMLTWRFVLMPPRGGPA